jgi:hypothetical protein
MKKSVLFYFVSFRPRIGVRGKLQPESSIFGALRTDWTPVFSGVTTQIQFFHSFGGQEGDGALLSAERVAGEISCKLFLVPGINKKTILDFFPLL